jgi:periplasmic protein TonB
VTASRSCPHCLVLGLVFSAVLHGAVVRLWPRTPAPEPPSAGALVLELAQFDPIPPALAEPDPPAPAAPPPTPAPAQQTAPPEPELAQPAPPPPATEPPPRRPKARDERPKPKPEPKRLPVKRELPRREPPAPPKPTPQPPAARSAATPAPVTAAAASPPKRAIPTGVASPAAPTRPSTSPEPPARPPRPIESAGAYLAEVQRAVARAQVYPEEARQTRKTGTTVVAFVIQSNGSITGMRLARSSGDPTLDRAALAAVGRVGRVRPIPASAGRSTWALQVPIRFSLR